MKSASPLFIILCVVTASTLFSCNKNETENLPPGGGILTPLAESSSTTGSNTDVYAEDKPSLPLVSPGDQYSILTLLDGNLDTEPADEQVMVALPLDDDEAPLSLMIASTNPIRNEYDIVWTAPLSRRSLSGITLRGEDMTGNGRQDLIVAGFDESGRHVTDIFGVSRRGALESYTRVFGLRVEGNIDIMTVERTAGYYSGLNSGKPYSIIVQKQDPNSTNDMDLIETSWVWNSSTFSFVEGDSRVIKAETILEERMRRVYSGNVTTYEDYLSGAWYRESGTGSTDDMLFFDPSKREMLFYDGAIQEAFRWDVSNRTTAKRLYAKVSNDVTRSMYDYVWVSAEAWDRIELTRANTDSWNGFYRRLGTVLQDVLDRESEMPGLLSGLKLSGVWLSPDGSGMVFELPKLTWTRDGRERSASVSLFELDETVVLQVRFMKSNGSFEETENWIVGYEEDGDETRIIRSLSLVPAELSATGVRVSGENMMRYEQIEIISSTESLR